MVEVWLEYVLVCRKYTLKNLVELGNLVSNLLVMVQGKNYLYCICNFIYDIVSKCKKKKKEKKLKHTKSERFFLPS